jgi:hypothetical protein
VAVKKKIDQREIDECYSFKKKSSPGDVDTIISPGDEGEKNQSDCQSTKKWTLAHQWTNNSVSMIILAPWHSPFFIQLQIKKGWAVPDGERVLYVVRECNCVVRESPCHEKVAVMRARDWL